jgi:hypothetical protein
MPWSARCGDDATRPDARRRGPRYFPNRLMLLGARGLSTVPTGAERISQHVPKKPTAAVRTALTQVA